jgi:acyl-CoA synthetase (NDP forming)
VNLFEAMFAPRAVALIGASGDASRNTARPQRYLRKHGYTGQIAPINSSREEVLGEKAFPCVKDVPFEIDHALIMVRDVEQALEDCAAKGIPLASIYTDGFADAGVAGVERQRRLVKRAKELGVRFLGPNSMGVIDIPGKLALTVNAVLEMDELPPGGTSIVSQSGTMLGTLLSRGAARGLGFAKLVSVGNEADLGVGELVEGFAWDPKTRVIVLFLETIRFPEKLARAARVAHAAGKPLVAYKLGRSVLGQQLARSHTGALAASDEALDAYFRDCGMLRVDQLETLLEISPLVTGRTPPQLARPGRVAVVTTTGGGAATVVDRLGTLGVELASMNDLTMAATPDSYRAKLDELMDSADCDAVLAAAGSSAQFHPQLAVEPIVRIHKQRKPVAAFFTPHAERSLALCAEYGIAAFRTPEACADALAAYLRWKAPQEHPALTPPGRLPRGPFAFFSALGVPVAEWQVTNGPEFLHEVEYPVAVKLAGVEHKSDKNALRLNIMNRKEFDQAVAALGGAAVLVQKMESGLAEAIVGYRDDPVVGPLVLVGAGGVLAEVYKDFSIRVAPVSEEEALAMIAEVKGLALVRGYRNHPPGDAKALARVVSAVSSIALMQGRPVAEAELNPILVKREGVVAVDALVVMKE